MIRFLAERLFVLFLTLLAAALVVFLVLDVLPGDPAALILGVNARPDTLAALHHAMGLDRPAALRFLAWLGAMLRGDFGESFTYHTPIAGLIADRVGVSLPLAALAITLSTLIAVPTGVFAASHHGKPADALAMAAAQIGVAVPNFWLGLLLILFFAVKLAWLPASGFPGWAGGLGPGLRALILPASALALPQAAILARVTRSAMLEILREDYLRTALAKGVSPRAALWRHAVPNALIPVVTILGLQFSFLLAGTIIIENVFTLPGLGRLIFQAIAGRDLIVVQDLVVLLSGSVIIVNFAVDLLYLLIDPRLRAEGGR